MRCIWFLRRPQCTLPPALLHTLLPNQCMCQLVSGLIIAALLLLLLLLLLILLLLLLLTLLLLLLHTHWRE